MTRSTPSPGSAATAASLIDDSLAAPFTRLHESAVVDLLHHGWAIEVAEMRRLGTERDDSFVVTGSDGLRHVVKVAHPLDDPDVLDLQCAAAAHAGDRDPTLPVPTLVPDVDGAVLRQVVGTEGEPRLARVLGYLEGFPLDYDATSTGQRQAIGRAAGRLSLALSDLEHRAAHRALAWDLQQVGTLRPLVHLVADPLARAAVEVELDGYDAGVGLALRQTRQQVVHHDLNADNLLVDPAHPAYLTGILDFGDVVHSSVVGDLAVAMAYAVGAGGALEHHDADPWVAPYDIADGFAQVRVLDDDEVALLPALVRLRLAQRLVLNSWLASADPSNAGYTGRSITRAGDALRHLATSPSPLEKDGA